MKQEGRSYCSISRGILNIPCAVLEPFGRVVAIPPEHTAMGDPSCVCIADRRMFSRDVLPVPPGASRNISLPSSLSILPSMKSKAILCSALSRGEF